MPNFADFPLSASILQALEKIQYREPTQVQLATIPLILQKKDLIAMAKTGSGKTAACAIPLCHQVDIQHSHIQVLIIVPTRELALQYATETQKIGGHKGVKAFALYGGENMSLQQSKLKHGVHILIATPGRLIDFIYSRLIDLTHVSALVLDEADEMLSMGFIEDLEFIIQCLNHPHQTLLFSATMPNAIRHIAKQYMKDPCEVSFSGSDDTPAKIEHQFFYCKHDEKERALVELIEKYQPKQSIIFCRSRHECEHICKSLERTIDRVEFLHAGLNQDIRTSITSKFRTGKIRFLVATDVAARGLDFSEVSHVFIFHLAENPELYVHRSGRTGRNEREGIVISFVTNREIETLKKVLNIIKTQPVWIGKEPDLQLKSKEPRVHLKRTPPQSKGHRRPQEGPHKDRHEQKRSTSS